MRSVFSEFKHDLRALADVRLHCLAQHRRVVPTTPKHSTRA